jgi:hypothetical protein
MKQIISTYPDYDDLSHAERELYLYIVHSGDFYRNNAQPIIGLLAKHLKSGKFDTSLAVRPFIRLAAQAANQYGTEGHSIFTGAERQNVAFNLLDYYMEEITEKAGK